MPKARKQTETSEDTKTIVTVLLLLFFFPVGFIVMWVWPSWKLWVKMLVSLPVIIILLFLFVVIPIVALNPEDKIKNSETRVDLVTPAPLYAE